MTHDEIQSQSREDFLAGATGTLFEGNFGDLELYRGRRVREIVGELADLYAVTDDRTKKAILFLVQDIPAADDERLRPVAEDGLNSVDRFTRLGALCQLTGDFGLFDELFGDTGPDEVKLAARVASYRAGRA